MVINVGDLEILKKRGVYQIRNLVNNKIYIGSTTTSFIYRWRQHCSKLKMGKHDNAHLQSSYIKYGDSNFEYTVLYVGISTEDIRAKEQEWINFLDTCNPSKGYNLEPTVDRHSRSEDTKKKISMNRRGKCVGPANGFYGKTHSEEVRNRIRQARLGKKMSDATKAKIVEKRKIKVKINGVIYPSIKEAAQELGMSKATLSRWVKDKRKTNYEIVQTFVGNMGTEAWNSRNL